MNAAPERYEEPAYELAEGGSTLRLFTHIAATLDDLLTIEINGPADSVRLSWFDALELSDAIRDLIGQGTFKEEALREAEKRGAVKALGKASDLLLTHRDKFRERRGIHTRWALGVEDAASEVRALSAGIESGEMPL